MRKCPHCQASLNPWRVMRVSRWRPYRCSHCGGLSHLNYSRSAWFAGASALITSVAWTPFLRTHPWSGLIPMGLTMVALLVLATLLFGDFRTVEADDAAKQ